jgi:hypothetical protein
MDMNWLATEAKTLHVVFSNMFFVLVTTFLVVGVVLEFFKIPLGSTPQFPQMVARVFIASMLLVAIPEIMNALATVTDAITKEIGQFLEFKHVLERLSDKFGEMSWSWVSIKDSVIILISYLSFFIFYISVYLADAFFLYSWMLIYVFSPLLVALYVFPMTANATTMLFKSIVEVCAWKLVWCVMSALLWSMALSDINNPEHGINFLTVIILNLMLAFSVILTPKITSSFLGGGVSSVAFGVGNKAFTDLVITPAAALVKGKLMSDGLKRAMDSNRKRQAGKRLNPVNNAKPRSHYHSMQS